MISPRASTARGLGDAGEPQSVAQLVARLLHARAVERVYGLCGGHIQPLWDAVARLGMKIIDVRHEGSACLMAQAEAELRGEVGVALVTAGPGATNAVTGIANAYSSQTPVVVIAGHVPRPQMGKGAMQELPQLEVVRPLCRYAATVLDPSQAAASLDAAFRAASGADGPPGPAYVEFPTDVLMEPAAPVEGRPISGRTAPAPSYPDPASVAEALQLIAASRRPLVIGGRGVRAAAAALDAFLTATGAVYLDSAESRGALPSTHTSAVPAMRARALREADLVITLGRRLNFQLGYGSPALFDASAMFLRIGTNSAETADNRRGDVELRCDVSLALSALVERGAAPVCPDVAWLAELRAENAERERKLVRSLSRQPLGADGRLHPYTLIAALNEHIGDGTITVVDGGDILSFGRVALRTTTYLDCGPLGCLGVGVPFAIAAALALPEAQVVALIGDGSFGFTAIEIDTAVRHGAKAVFVVANNEGWNIERKDQEQRYAGNLVGVELPGCRYDLLAQALGARGRRVEEAGELEDAIGWALANAPAVLDVLVTRDAESPDFKSGLAQVPARQALSTWDEAEEARAVNVTA